MCIIAVKPKGVSIPENILKNCWDNNHDGAGFMYAENNKLNIIKGLMTFDSFLEAYNKINPLDKKVVIHFRFGTHGDICPNLTHPFRVNDNLAFVHNGIFQIDLNDPYGQDNKIEPNELEEYIKAQDVSYDLMDLGEEDIPIDNDSEEKCYLQQYSPQIIKGIEEVSDTSDSLELCKILKNLPKKFLNNKTIYFLLNAYISSSNSVVVFMDNIGNINIVGDNGHNVENGVWYSNTGYLDKKVKKCFQSIDLDEFNRDNPMTEEKKGEPNERVENN